MIKVTTINKGLCVEYMGIPPSLNQYVCTGVFKGRIRRYLSKEHKAFKKLISESIPKDFKPLENNLEVHIKLTFPDRRKHDIDNYFKSLFDALTGKAFIDDSQITFLKATKCYSRRISRTIIMIKEIE